MRKIKTLALVAAFVLSSLCAQQALAAKVTVYGTGGVNLKDGTICPHQSQHECATLEINGSEITAIIKAVIKDDYDYIFKHYTVMIVDMPEITPEATIYGKDIKLELIPK